MSTCAKTSNGIRHQANQVPLAGCLYSTPSIVVVNVPVALKYFSSESMVRWNPPWLVLLVPLTTPVCTTSDTQLTSFVQKFGMYIDRHVLVSIQEMFAVVR